MDIENELKRIYIERNNEYIALEKQGIPREEILRRLEHYQDEINALFPAPKSKKKEIGRGGVIGIYKLLDCKSDGKLTINGKAVYSRLFIKKIGYEICVNEEENLWELFIEPEELYDYLNKNAKYFEAILEGYEPHRGN